jgi:glycosyltransferase involved in cell wall biosynthesis
VKARKKILFIRTDWGVSEYRKANNAYGGIGYYRIVKPAQALAEAYPDDYEVTVWGKEVTELGETAAIAYPKLFNSFDLVICKDIDGVNASNMLAVAEYCDKPLLLDIDDNLVALREDNPAYAYYGKGKQDRYFKMALYSLAPGIIASTDPLKKALSKLSSNRIDVLPNCCDPRDWDFEKKKHYDGMIRIGYAGGVSHNQDLELVKPAMLAILRKYPNVRFEILGAYDKPEALKMISEFADVADRIQFFAGTPSWNGYPQALASMGWDIAIAPLIRDDFNESKSHIKWMEMSMLKIPTVASGVYPYKESISGTPVIEQGKTGFLVKTATPEYWETYLSQLIEQPELRTQMGQHAYDAVSRNWNYSHHIHKWKQVIEHYLNGTGTSLLGHDK